jgi:hypothetical protein
VYTTAAGTEVDLFDGPKFGAINRCAIHRAEHYDKVDAALANVDNLDRETLIWLVKDLADDLRERDMGDERDVSDMDS